MYYGNFYCLELYTFFLEKFNIFKRFYGLFWEGVKPFNHIDNWQIGKYTNWFFFYSNYNMYYWQILVVLYYLLTFICAIPDCSEHGGSSTSGRRRRVLGSHMCSLLPRHDSQHHEVNWNSNEGLLLLSSVLRLIGDGTLVGVTIGLCGIYHHPQKSSFF